MIKEEVPAIVATETGVVGAGAIMLHRGMTDAHDGVDPVALTRWLAAEVPRVELGDGPVAVERISGGHSNLTSDGHCHWCNECSCRYVPWADRCQKEGENEKHNRDDSDISPAIFNCFVSNSVEGPIRLCL